MSYTGRVDNIKITSKTSDTITLTVHNPMVWDNAPSDTSVTFNMSSIPNLIAALKEVKQDYW